MSRDTIGLTFAEIEIGDARRSVDRDAVKRIAASIKEIGLQHPITVRSIKGRFHLVAGRHRLEAVRSLGHETVKAVVVSLDNIDARRWEIAENLHRAELTVQERSDQISEWVRLTEEKRVSRQVDAKPQGGRPEGGVRAASRELGISEPDARRSMRIAAISEGAKEAAREAGLDDNQSALLRVAKAEPERQVEVVRQLAHPRDAGERPSDGQEAERQLARLVSAWNAAGPAARQEFLLRIDQPVMDRRHDPGGQD